MDNSDIMAILRELGERVPPASRLTLLGGSALALLGSLRQTIDIDFLGDDVNPTSFHKSVMKIAQELKVHVEPVPLERFIPLPKGNEERSIHIGQFGNLEIYVADPYSIALSKIDRGTDTDYDDLVFLVQKRLVKLGELERIVRAALPLAREFDLDPDILNHLQELKNRLQ